jgi:hypothetical protein
MIKPTADIITAWGTAAAAFAAIIAVIVSYIQADKSRKDFKLSLAADLSLKLADKFDSEDFQHLRAYAAESLLNHRNEIQAEDVFDFFETVGVMVQSGAITPKLAHNFFFHWVNLYWIAGHDHIKARRQDTRLVWDTFEDLYSIVTAIEKQRDRNSKGLNLANDPELLRKYLEEELPASS